MSNKIYKSIEQFIGNTPLLQLCNLEKQFNLKATMLAKLESFNPAGSSKDRVAIAMIDDAEKRGLINKNSVIIEPTSGNTGIGLALVGINRGYRVIIVMPETMSVERRTLIKAYGAELVLTEAHKGMQGAIEKANQLAKEIENSFIPGQFTNFANSQIHFETTGPEIFRDTDGSVDIFIAGIGTGGTISGVGKYLKSVKPNVKIVGVEPSLSPVLSKGISGKHQIQGIGAGFVPEILDKSVIDEVVCIKDEVALEMGRLMAKKQSLLVGISSGAVIAAAIELAQKTENKGKTIVALLPDSGERYLSTKLYLE